MKSSPFCSEPAAAVSITCQETPNRTASPFDELASRTNETPGRYLADSKLSEPLLSIPYNSRCSAVFFAAPNKRCSGPLNLFGTYGSTDLCSLTCVADSNLPALARHVKPNNRVRESNICTVRESKIRSFSTGLDGTQSKPYT